MTRRKASELDGSLTEQERLAEKVATLNASLDRQDQVIGRIEDLLKAIVAELRVTAGTEPRRATLTALQGSGKGSKRGKANLSSVSAVSGEPQR